MLTLTDIFAGAGGSSTGAISVPDVRVRIAANHSELAVNVHNLNHPTTDHACVDLHMEDPRNFPQTDMLWASPECFAAGHLVTTTRGQVPIEQVAVGDRVLTHEGRWRPVLRVQSRTAPTVIVKGQGHAGIETTASHRFWLRDSRRKCVNRQVGHKREYDEPAWMEIGHAVEHEALWATPANVEPLPIPDVPTVFGRDLVAAWWMIGRWVGDGSLTFGKNHSVDISCGHHEADELRTKLAATGAGWAEYSKRTAASFYLGDKPARDWLGEHFGHGAAEKQIPAWALAMPTAHRQALLDGYHSADGYVNALTHGSQHRISTISCRLAVSVRLLIESLGYRTSVGTDKRTTYLIEGRTGPARKQYIVCWNQTPSPTRHSEAWADELHTWSSVRSVTRGSEEVAVYNIEVAEDHSYVLDGIVVANCTKWSIANSKAKALSVEMGGDPTLFDDVPVDLESGDQDEISRSRLLMFDVLRFIEHHRYRAVVVENVVDIATQAKYAGAWQAWQRGLRKLGYKFKVVSLNSMHAQAFGMPAPQSRDRLYVVAWPENEKPFDIDAYQRPKAWCPRCEKVVESRQAWKNGRTVGRYRAQYVYVCAHCGTAAEPGWLPASAAIDWSIEGQRIGDRERPLSPKTMARIREGLRRYGHQFLVPAGGTWHDSAHATSNPHRTFTTREAHGLVLDAVHGAPIIGTTDDPLWTQTTAYTRSLLVPTEGRDGKSAMSDGRPMRTQTTRNELGILTTLRGENAPKLTREAMDTVAASGNHHGLLMPYYSASRTANPTSGPIGTLTTVDRYALIMRHNNGSRGGSDAGMVTPDHEPFRTLTTTGHQSVLEPTTIEPEDCTFRMLEPHEIAAGMSFPDDYKWSGTKRERVRLAGNAVTPPAARDLVSVIAANLGSGA